MDVEVWQPTVELVMRFEVEKKTNVIYITRIYLLSNKIFNKQVKSKVNFISKNLYLQI